MSRQIVHMRGLAMPPYTHLYSKPCSKVGVLTSLQAKRFAKRCEGTPCDPHLLLLVFGAFVIVTPFVSGSAMFSRA